MKNIIKHAVLMVLIFAAAAFADELKIVHVNLQKALNDSDAGISAKEELSKEAKRLEEELNKYQEELKKLKEEFDKKMTAWNQQTKEQKEKELKAKEESLQKQFVKYGEELNNKKQEREKTILEGLEKAIKDMVKEKGYTIVLESSGVLYAPADADITGELITEYNKRAKK